MNTKRESGESDGCYQKAVHTDQWIAPTFGDDGEEYQQERAVGDRGTHRMTRWNALILVEHPTHPPFDVGAWPVNRSLHQTVDQRASDGAREQESNDPPSPSDE